VSLDRINVAGFELAQPVGLLALLVLVPIILAWRYAARRRRAADEAYGGAPQLRSGGGAGWRRVGMMLTVTVVVLLALGIARPRWGTEPAGLERRGIDVAIALDVSRSMLATDVDPSRADAAAEGLRDMLSHLRGDRVSLTIFAGSAFERSPLTLDLEAVAQLVARAKNEAPLVRSGSDLGLAIEQALASLNVEDPAETQVIVLISDGEDLSDRLDIAIETARDRSVRIYTVPVGTGQGTSLEDGQFSRTDRATLGEIAAATGAELREVETVAGLAVEFRQLALTVFDESSDATPVERFQWLVATALVLLLLRGLLPQAGPHRPLAIGRLQLSSREGFATARHGLAAGGLLAMLFLAGCAGTSAFQHVEDGNDAFATGDFDAAQVEYTGADDLDPENPAILYNRANALHELRRFEEAKSVYEQAQTLVQDAELANQLRYGTANTDLRRDALEDARDGYISVLRNDPDDLDAKANLELVLLRLRPPEPPRDEPPDSSSEEPPGGEPGTPGEGPSADPGSGDEPGAQAGGQGDGQAPGEQPDDGSGATPGGQPQPSDGRPGQGDSFNTLEEALAALEEAQATLGEEITLEEARLLLDLTAQANALRTLQGGSSGGPVAR
jgi:Ca-activated chloride channel family protein